MRRAFQAVVSRYVGVTSSRTAGCECLRGAVQETAVNAQSAALSSGTPRSCWWLMQLSQAPLHGSLLPHSVRHYAKPAKAAAPAAKPAPTGPKRHRTSSTKLYSIRNDRLRHTHEQIWPTLKLTDAELAMFRRNSRLFVVDMGRSISLQTKFRLGQLAYGAQWDQGSAEQQQQKQGQEEQAGGLAAESALRKVPYQQARTLLYEPQMHLDALGENPRYLRVRRVRTQYSTKLQNLRKLRLLLGFQRRKFVQRMYEHALMTPGSHRMWKLVCAMEANLAMFATRMGLAEDSVGAVYAVDNHKLYVNGRHPTMPRRGTLLPGDVVSPAAGGVAFFRNVIARSMQPVEADVVRCFM